MVKVLSLDEAWDDVPLQAETLVYVLMYLEKWFAKYPYLVVSGDAPELAFRSHTLVEFAPEEGFPVEYCLGNPTLGLKIRLKRLGYEPFYLEWTLASQAVFANWPLARVAPLHRELPTFEVVYLQETRFGLLEKRHLQFGALLGNE